MSCLVEKLKYYIDLTEHEKTVLDDMEKSSRQYKKSEIIYEQDDVVDNIYIVRHGWLASYSYMKDGGRLILNVHFPGDIIGTMSLAYEGCASGLVSLQKAELCPFPKKELKRLFSTCPRLTALMLALGMQDNIVLVDRLKAIGRMAGENRVLMFLLQTWARQKITDSSIENSFDFPISQEIMGDALGITPVYVNRVLKQLQADGLISYHKPRMTLNKLEAIKTRCDFRDRYYKLDTSWYPS